MQVKITPKFNAKILGVKGIFRIFRINTECYNISRDIGKKYFRRILKEHFLVGRIYEATLVGGKIKIDITRGKNRTIK